MCLLFCLPNGCAILFQDEIDCLQREVEELKSKNLSLESQIKTMLDPLALMQGNQHEDKHPAADNAGKIDPAAVVAVSYTHLRAHET